ncbi:MAG: amino acid adenylation domain-containing protein, partial [Halanaerobiales bacterium]|nr:amino acid adenylation domain-containing protein [Halanaerobiales bacterium]
MKSNNEIFLMPLSFAQQRLWFMHQIESKPEVFNVRAASRLRGILNTKALELSLQEIIHRHETLRTTFEIQEEEPVQAIHPPSSYELSIVVKDHIPVEDREKEISKFIKDETKRPFDLENGPLFRITLLKLGEEDFVLCITMHHIITDGWSFGIFMGELMRLYEVYQVGGSSPLSELPIQYADYAIWQRDMMQGEVLQKPLDFWQEHLGNDLPVLDLPTDFLRPPKRTSSGASYGVSFSQEMTQKLKNLCNKEEVSLFMVSITALNILLYHYTNQEDIVVGTPVANRNMKEIEDLMGFFVNTLALRTDMSNNPTFRELLARVKDNTLNAYDHQDIPFDKLLAELQIQRDKSRTPVFQVMLTLENTPFEDLKLPGLTLTPIIVEDNTAKFDLTVSLRVTEREITEIFNYSTDLFKEETIKRMSDHFKLILKHILQNADQRIAEIPLLTETERNSMQLQWKKSLVDPISPKSIEQLFEDEAKMSPNRIAVVCGNKQLTYHELNIRSNQLANHLRQLGVSADTPVAIYLNRSVEMIVSLLAILKAGGHYVPIDPVLPKKRIDFMLEDSGTTVVLTEEKLADTLSHNNSEIVCVDSIGSTLKKNNTENLNLENSIEQLAYIIYTSGSTGKPKGVLVQHKNLINYISGLYQVLKLEKGMSYATVSTLAADLGNTSIFTSLCTGGELHIFSQESLLNPKIFSAYMAQNKVDCLKITPSHLTTLLKGKDIKNILPEKYLILGGEALRKELVEKIRDLGKGCKIINHYGPSETTIGVLMCPIDDEIMELSNETVPIGRAIPDTEVYLLNSHMLPVPIGVLGEIYIGGKSVTKGYLNRDELTDSRFIKSPFKNGESLYKTGDLCRYLPKGYIEFIGRVDNQVKIRGFRIEIGEIETVLKGHPQIQEVVILINEELANNPRLIAYVIPNDKAMPSSKELRSYLEERLPEYMIPFDFIELTALPLTPNGKIDKNGLPKVDGKKKEYILISPRTRTEEMISESLAQLLGREVVGINENFFEIGGHSLLATQLVLHLRVVFNIDLPLNCFLDNPTVEALAKWVDKLVEDERTYSSIEPIEVRAYYETSSAQKRMYILNNFDKNSLNYNMPNIRIIEGELDVEKFKNAIELLVTRHESLRTSFEMIGEDIVQWVHDEVELDIPYMELEGEELETRIYQFIRPFDLNRAPLMRAELIKLSEEKHMLLFDIHHIISDGVSMGIIWSEISELYKGNTLPELRVQYKDFSVWQNKLFKSEAINKQEEYWLDVFKGEITRLNMPTDFKEPPVQTFEGEHIDFKVDRKTYEKIRKVMQETSSTMYMVLLAAYNVLLAKYTGQT